MHNDVLRQIYTYCPCAIFRFVFFLLRMRSVKNPTWISNLLVAANEHQGSMKCQENRDRRKMPTKSRGYVTGT